jgi:hypothetical protein
MREPCSVQGRGIHVPFVKDHGGAPAVLAHTFRTFRTYARVIYEACRACEHGEHDGDEPARLARAVVIHQPAVALQEGELVEDRQEEVELVKVSLYLCRERR